MTREEAARILDPETSRDELWKYDADTRIEACNEACRMGADALRAQQERENPKPLTPDELKEMDGEPVWIIPLCVDTGWTAQWRIYTVREPVTVNAKSYGWYGLHLKDYGKTWVAYRHKPKEGQA